MLSLTVIVTWVACFLKLLVSYFWSDTAERTALVQLLRRIGDQ